MNPIPPATNTLPDWFDRFPEPRTMPGGWDLSSHVKTTATQPATSAASTPAPLAADETDS